MKYLSVILLLALTVLFAGCGPETDDYNRALDADRDARAKMITALNAMKEQMTQDEISGEDYMTRDTLTEKEAEAVDAYVTALESWKTARQMYNELLTLDPESAVYKNNLGNLFYNMYMSGLQVNLSRAEALYMEAVQLNDHEAFRRNLELLGLAAESEEVAANQELVTRLRTLQTKPRVVEK